MGSLLISYSPAPTNVKGLTKFQLRSVQKYQSLALFVGLSGSPHHSSWADLRFLKCGGTEWATLWSMQMTRFHCQDLRCDQPVMIICLGISQQGSFEERLAELISARCPRKLERACLPFLPSPVRQRVFPATWTNQLLGPMLPLTHKEGVTGDLSLAHDSLAQ